MTQTNSERKLENIATQVADLIDRQDARVVGSEAMNRLGVLSRRLGEHRNGSFIVLVVGAVKSGKSTLVNLLSHRYVSPTDKLECTVRPSIVSGVGSADDERITVYRSRGTDRQVADLDLVVDSLRGLMPDADMKEILDVGEYPLSDENIDRVVFPAFNRVDDTLITGITVTGSPLLAPGDAEHGQVFLVDMPGFDGSNVNYIEDPRYDAMSRRVDLILFVHSSVSAFSVTASRYLDSLREHNGGAPVVLIHNVFDSTYWRGSESRSADVDRQLTAQMDEISRKGFNIKRENCFAIDLGMVSDYRAGNYREECETALAAEAERFAAVETSLHGLIIGNISDLRVNRCLERARLMRDNLVTALGADIASLDAVLDARLRALEKLSTLRVDCAMPSLEVSKLAIEEREASLQAITVLDNAIATGSQSLDYDGCVSWLSRLAAEYFELVDHDLTTRVLTWYRKRVGEYDAALRETGVANLPAPVLEPQESSLMDKFLPDGVEQFVPERPLWKKVLLQNYKADAVREMVRSLRGHLLVESRFDLRVKAEIERLATDYVAHIERHYRLALDATAAPEVGTRHEALVALRDNLQDIIF